MLVTIVSNIQLRRCWLQRQRRASNGVTDKTGSGKQKLRTVQGYSIVLSLQVRNVDDLLFLQLVTECTILFKQTMMKEV